MLEPTKSLRMPMHNVMKTNALKEARAELRVDIGGKAGLPWEELQIKQDRNTRAKLLRVGQIEALSF